jgi:SP family general alpha glucoside:H+ symporter-like MFS transporter
MIGMVAMTACIFVLFFAVNIEMIMIGNLLAGIPWGIFQASILFHTRLSPTEGKKNQKILCGRSLTAQVITTAYASEIVPPALRGVSLDRLDLLRR